MGIILYSDRNASIEKRENLSPFSFRFSPCMTTCWGSTLFGSWVCHCPPWPWWRSLVISGHVTVTLLETCSSSQPRYLQMTTSSVKQNQVRTGINMEIGSLEWSKKENPIVVTFWQEWYSTVTLTFHVKTFYFSTLVNVLQSNDFLLMVLIIVLVVPNNFNFVNRYNILLSTDIGLQLFLFYFRNFHLEPYFSCGQTQISVLH